MHAYLVQCLFHQRATPGEAPIDEEMHPAVILDLLSALLARRSLMAQNERLAPCVQCLVPGLFFQEGADMGMV